MECTWDAALLRCGDLLPPELLQIIAQNGDPDIYLQAITKAALDPRYTYTLFAHCEDIFAHISATLRLHGSLASAVATLGRIVPFAPYLQPYAQRLLESENYSFSPSNGNEDDVMYLLGLFRLFAFDPRNFKKYIKPDEITLLLQSPSRPIVYLAIRILQIYLNGADHWFEQMLKRYLGADTPEGAMNGLWDDKIIDYRFLTLWEEHRYETMLRLIEIAQSNLKTDHLAQNDLREAKPGPTIVANGDSTKSLARSIPVECFDKSTTCICGILLPINITAPPSPVHDRLVPTATTWTNLRNVAFAIKLSRPLLLSGLSGAGKSTAARYVAGQLGYLDKLVTLHLNEQSDAKMLLGIHTTGDTPGSFVWKAGVLTTAVKEGRWILIEDLDRAPNDIIGTLLPLIEKGELLIPNRKETIHAAPGFRIIATVRSTIDYRGAQTEPLTNLLGARHWQRVSLKMLPADEWKEIATQLYPSLVQLLPQFLSVYDRVQTRRQRFATSGQGKAGVLRPVSPQDFLRWCNRVAATLRQGDTLTSADVDEMFVEAVDCFVGAFPDCPLRTEVAAVVAEELRIDPQRRDYLLSDREIRYELDKSRIIVGRYSLSRAHTTRKPSTSQSFSTNRHTTRMLERVAAAVTTREPLLLVGETGVGKTTAVQHLATHLGKTLVAFNLSQQSEGGDLLGGFKPVSARSLIVPLKDEFDELFSASFSLRKNQQFLELLGKQMSKGNWKSVCKIWAEALKMVEQQRTTSNSRPGEAPSKKRKVEPKAIDFDRWDAFASKVAETERLLAAGPQSFAFSFVEGRIVQAVRNGDWVLLDEINLASSDTLESIADLFESRSPSILLAEAGNIERIDAHPDFRIFAAMNPATDVGKKDLPPGIRSRFTELYVESPDKDLESLQSIVRSYLRHEATTDQAVALDTSVLYQKIIQLAEQNKLADGAGQRPHFSLRTLTRTLSFAKHIATLCSLRRALYEGFQMSFITFLDAESAAILQPLLEHHLFGKRTNIKAELQKPLRKPNDGNKHLQGYPGSKHWVRQGNFEVEEQPHYILTPFIRSNLENLVRAASTTQFPVLLQGPTSSGKTSMIEYLAKRTGHKFVRINNHEHTDLQEYLGTYISDVEGRLYFQEGILVKAIREGHWIVLDELNLAPTDVLEALNRLLDDNRELLVPETQEVVRPHENFMLFATQNPAGLYGGRKALSRAFRNRFLELHFDDIPVDELQEILHKRTLLPESRCKRIVQIYRELSVLRQESRLFEQRSFATLRDLFRWAFRPNNDVMEDLATNGFMLLGERVRKAEERQMLKIILQKVVSSNNAGLIDEDRLYARQCKEILHYENRSKDSGVVWTKAMRRLYVLVSRAIENNEPVLLVGDTGCGKTTVCQMLARAFGKELYTVNAHQNTETGDLIGSQRPVRNRAVIEANLRHQLLSTWLLQSLDTAAAYSTDALLDAYDRAVAGLEPSQKRSHSQSTSHAEIQTLRTRYKALFEWNDGALVQAMKTGDFFLLDEISLADDSVLERINSVLEQQRSVLLAEKGSLESYVVAASGFQFFATMNPGGDYGKRELSPALRNRFTEIWVPPLDDAEDVEEIVLASLVSGLKPHAQAMVEFAQWFKERFNTSASLSISIRDILAWVNFSNVFATQDPAEALVHGAAMVYVDTLGANPAGLMNMTQSNVDQERAACLRELSKLLKIDAEQIYSCPVSAEMNDRSLVVGLFSVSGKTSTIPPELSFSFRPQTTRKNAMRVLRALQLPKPVMLEGSPGVGKTALIVAIAKSISMPLTRINLSDQTDLIDLFGSDVPVEGVEVGTFAWRDAPFLRAMKNGEWVLLDEMNLASQSVLEGLNACLDHRGEVFVPELGQTFRRHPDFRLFAAQNPHHQGGGRKGLPASFVNRFTVVFADAFRPEDLLSICTETYPDLEPVLIQKAVQFVHKLDHEATHNPRLGANGRPWEFNLRDLNRWLSLASTDHGLLQSATSRDLVEFLFSQRFRSASDKAFVYELFSRCFEDFQQTSDLFPSISTRTLQVGIALLSRDPEKTAFSNMPPDSQHFRLRPDSIQSIMLCVQQNWPVILSGSAGSGKTALIEHLANAVGASVVNLAMNAETDVMDLLGGYEQADVHRRSRALLDALYARFESISRDRVVEFPNTDAVKILTTLEHNNLSEMTTSEIGSMSALLDGAEAQQLGTILEEILQATQSVDRARFEWVDGLLIECLIEGKWLVLDNANLCSPSVLDRLNSLLEPGGVLAVNEHNGPDGLPRTIRPHPNFRIFLTVNPKYGELSRAMRNRAVEINLPDLPAPEMHLGPCLPLHESSLARFSQVKILNAPEVRPETYRAILNTVQDHFGTEDESLVTRFEHQLRNGLYSGAPGNLDVALSDPTGLLTENGHRTKSFYQSCSRQLQVPADFAKIQTLHPLNNQALVQSSQHVLSEASLLSLTYDVALGLASVANALTAIETDKAAILKVRTLERSLGLRYPSRQTQPNRSIVITLMQTSMHGLFKLLHEVTSAEGTDLHVTKRVFGEISSIFMMILDAIKRHAFEAPNLVAMISYTKNMAQPRTGAVLPTLAVYLTQLHRDMTSTGVPLGNFYGLACTALWKALRPGVPTTLEQLNDVLRFETALEKFDASCQRFDQSVESMADLRISIARTLQLVEEGVHDSTLESLTGMFESLLTPSSDSELSKARRPYFHSAFRCLYEHFSMIKFGNTSMPSQMELAKLCVLAARPSKDSMVLHSTSSVSSIQHQVTLLDSIVSNVIEGSTELVLHTRLGGTLLQTLNSTSKISLRQLDLFRAECQTLGTLIGSQTHLLAINATHCSSQFLEHLLRVILQALAGLTDAPQIQQAAIQLIAPLSKDLDEPGMTDVAGALKNLTIGPNSQESLLLTRLHEVVIYCRATLRAHGASVLSPAEAWATVACAGLQLYISEISFDPALESHLRRDNYRRQHGKLSSQLEAVRIFRKALTSTASSLRVRFLEADLLALGPEPAYENVYRPERSQIEELQPDLEALLRIIQPIWNNHGRSDSRSLLDRTSLANVIRIRDRLINQHRAYDDFTFPIVGFIDCLLIAQRFAIQSRDIAAPTTHRVLSDLVPFVGASFNSWLQDKSFTHAYSAIDSQEGNTFWLSALSARSAIWPIAGISSDLRVAIHEQFQRFYARWRNNLEEEQRKAAAKSSIYKFRGQTEDDEPTLDELEEYFPTEYLQSTDNQAEKTSPQSPDPAESVAALHRAVFLPSKVDHGYFLELIRQLSKSAALEEFSRDEVDLLPAVVRSIGDLGENLSVQTTVDPNYDIYRSPNIAEAQSLHELLTKILIHFQWLHQVWPEHATPLDVLTSCHDILELSYETPLSQFLPKVEKLHGIVNEWQKITSREYNANDIHEELVSLIVRWRQSELSTWAKLLDREWMECERNASSWWYVAYESIVAASIEIENTPNKLQGHVEALVMTLGDFLNSSGLGEFGARLRMLRGFEAHVVSAALDTPTLDSVRSAVVNLIRYYARFEVKVNEALSRGRSTLEKEIRTVIQLASWKERNIDALRQSAQSSRRRLLRLVRKYRKLLGQPVLPVVEDEFPPMISIHTNGHIDDYSHSNATVLSSAGLSNLSVWTDRPHRYRNVSATADLMSSKMARTQGRLDAAERIVSFSTSLQQSILELRKETPSVLSKENEAFVNHLKTRKRRLLADVLKDLRSMGFRVSMNQQALEQQASNFAILARMPNLHDSGETIRSGEAEYEFHRFLSYMPKARSAARKPSEDITAAEVSRCTSLLESVLDVSVTQYCVLSSHLEKTADLDQAHKQLRNFTACDVSSAGTMDSRLRRIQAARINCLALVLPFTIDALKMQQKLAGHDYSGLAQEFEAKLTELKEIQGEATRAPHLPSNIHSAGDVAIESRFITLVDGLQSAIQHGISAHPELQPVLLQLGKWLDAGESCVSDPQNLNRVHKDRSLFVWAHEMFETLDAILGSIQDVETKIPTQLEEAKKSAWLIGQYKTLNGILDALEVQRTGKSLLALVSQIQHLHTAQNGSLMSVAAMCQALSPILQAYHEMVHGVLKRSIELFVQLNRTGSSLARGFLQLATNGFCSPSGKSEGDSKEEGSLEDGTGLGDGEGAEDISKDVGDDEDLSELAQQEKQDTQRGETEDEKDAVDMADEEMAGDADDAEMPSGDQSDDEDGEMEDAENVDEEVEDGDTGGPSAVDEKMWDGAEQENQTTKEADSGGKEKNSEELAAATDGKDRDQANADENNDAGHDDAGPDVEELEHESHEKMDPHTDHEQNLELPEDINFDGRNPDEDDDSDNELMQDEQLDEAEVADNTQAAEDIPLEETKTNDIDEGDDPDTANADNQAADDFDEGSNKSNDDIDSDTLMQNQQDTEFDDVMNDFATSGTDGRSNLEDPSLERVQEQQSPRVDQEDADMDASDKPEDGRGTVGQNSTSKINDKPPSQPTRDSTSTSFKQLGDALKQWYDQHQKIQDAEAPNEEQSSSRQDQDMADAQFQHLPDADAKEDAQALGAASADQQTALDEENALQVNDQNHEPNDMLEEDSERESDDENEGGLPHDDRKIESEDNPQHTDQVGSFIGKSTVLNEDLEMTDDMHSPDTDTMETPDDENEGTPDHAANEMTLEEARIVWSHHKEKTRNLALVLTEHLRLILQPTQATKLRGDFRTGKRLNIKRIIPYIASSYKRDKIWMRRSVPSKRSYQVMLAIDDSKSMTENQSRELAFETLALVARSMSMLEVGELSVVGFGSDVKIAHEFSSHFNSDTGANTLRQFTFDQDKTNVRRLLEESIKFFQAARLKATGSASDLWQLQLIISDGICEDHPSIRQLVRQAQEERIMVVFIIVDSAMNQCPSTGENKQSILDLQTAEFVKDASGESQVKMLKYLDTFPFQYYLIVRDVQELPTVLAGALRQWFAEVVDVGS